VTKGWRAAAVVSVQIPLYEQEQRRIAFLAGRCNDSRVKKNSGGKPPLSIESPLC